MTKTATHENEIKKRQIFYHIDKAQADKIQIIKLFFSIMVVFIHSYTEEIFFADSTIVIGGYAGIETIKFILSKIIGKCAVPGFFLISAMLLYRKEFTWGENIKRKITTLLVPYLILNTFWIAFNYIVHEIEILSPFFKNQQSRVVQWGIMEWLDAYLGISKFPVLYPLWFIRDLFILNIISKILKWLIDKFPQICLIFIIVMLFSNISSSNYRQIADSIAFFSLGYYIVKYDLHYKDLNKTSKRLVAFIYPILVITNYLTWEMPINPVFRVSTNVIGILFFAICSDYFIHKEYKNKLLWMANYNYSIYLFHEFSLTSLRKIWFKIFSTSAFLQETAYFVLPLIIIVFCIVLSRIMEKFVPRLYCILTGNRRKV